MSAICLRCRQQYSEADHQCLEVMTLDELFAHELGAVRRALDEKKPYPGDLELDENGDFKLSDSTKNLEDAIRRRLAPKKDEP